MILTKSTFVIFQ